MYVIANLNCLGTNITVPTLTRKPQITTDTNWWQPTATVNSVQHGYNSRYSKTELKAILHQVLEMLSMAYTTRITSFEFSRCDIRIAIIWSN